MLDGMALVYRAHFAFINSPIFSSAGVNTSALYGFTNTLVDLIQNQKPTHLAIVFDTSAPTVRHKEFPEYKANRDEMPEDLREAIPNVKRLGEAFQIPVITLDGYEADDIIGTLAKRAEASGDTETFMVTPDKDFAQLVSIHTHIYKPGYRGSPPEILKLQDVLDKWEVERPEQVIDILGLWGDASDNIPGIPKIGEKTAKKLVKQFGSVEGLLENTDQLKGKQKENVENFAEQGRLSRKLAEIIIDCPVDVSVEDLSLKGIDEDKVKNLFVEFEFNAIGKRLFGSDFKAGRGFAVEEKKADEDEAPLLFAELKSIDDVEAKYAIAATKGERAKLIKELESSESFGFVVDGEKGKITGLGFAISEFHGAYVPISDPAVTSEFAAVFSTEGREKICHHVKHSLSLLAWEGLTAQGPFFDPMIAHQLIAPDQKHGIEFLAESLLGYTVIEEDGTSGGMEESGQLTMLDIADDHTEKRSRRLTEFADVSLRLMPILKDRLGNKGQEKVFFEIECPLVPVLVEMERIGVALDTEALADFSAELQKEMDALEKDIYLLAGEEFNLNSPKQLGEILFGKMQLVDKPKKTKTGQFKTNEEVLSGLATEHEIAQKILDFRESSKLKSTYVDALPHAIDDRTGRVHTTYLQLVTATGRIQSNGPNLQNIPIRTEQGREIRKAFVAGSEGGLIFSADYSQIELRVMAELSGDEAMLEAFQQGHDIHAATSAKVFGVHIDDVTPEMRRTAKMVNFGIIYGITQFGLAQRLRIPRKEAGQIIHDYKKEYHGVSAYMERVVRECRQHGYVETITGRRRYIRDVNSSNNTVRSAAERTAINSPIQGSAADMIKIAMIRIADELRASSLKSQMLMQVHDELVFETSESETQELSELVTKCMKTAIPMKVPIVVDWGVGKNWLDAH